MANKVKKEEVVETPVVETPVVETPVVETPVVEKKESNDKYPGHATRAFRQ
jgi:hypothetical protein